MEFDHEEHARTGHNLLRTSEELIETLEENQVIYPLFISIFCIIILVII